MTLGYNIVADRWTRDEPAVVATMPLTMLFAVVVWAMTVVVAAVSLVAVVDSCGCDYAVDIGGFGGGCGLALTAAAAVVTATLG